MERAKYSVKNKFRKEFISPCFNSAWKILWFCENYVKHFYIGLCFVNVSKLYWVEVIKSKLSKVILIKAYSRKILSLIVQGVRNRSSEISTGKTYDKTGIKCRFNMNVKFEIIIGMKIEFFNFFLLSLYMNLTSHNCMLSDCNFGVLL